MPQLISSRDFVKISDAAKILGVTEQTLRNWDRAGRLVPQRHPINGYRMYRAAELHRLLREMDRKTSPLDEQVSLDLGDSSSAARVSVEGVQALVGEHDQQLAPCHWSPEVALDPKHRPQLWNAPSTTVRRDWRKYPQEAHVLDESGTKYRRLTVEEIAIIQGFDPAVVRVEALTARERIAALGDAVPPPLAEVLVRCMGKVRQWRHPTAVEICAGVGGLAEGVARAGLEHLRLVDHSNQCGALLRNARRWKAERVIVADLRSLDLSSLVGKVGLLSGGPPCQPWSQAGLHGGVEDSRDLFSELPTLVETLRPEAFLFENVPGLASSLNRAYLQDVVARLREPSRDLSYGVLVALLNAADYGVPQVRERIFVVGFRDAPAALAYRCFDLVAGAQTHQRPDRVKRLPSWLTLRDAFANRQDPGGWRRWVTS